MIVLRAEEWRGREGEDQVVITSPHKKTQIDSRAVSSSSSSSFPPPPHPSFPLFFISSLSCSFTFSPHSFSFSFPILSHSLVPFLYLPPTFLLLPLLILNNRLFSSCLLLLILTVQRSSFLQSYQLDFNFLL